MGPLVDENKSSPDPMGPIIDRSPSYPLHISFMCAHVNPPTPCQERVTMPRQATMIVLATVSWPESLKASESLGTTAGFPPLSTAFQQH